MRSTLIALTFLLFAGWATPALAQEDGVFYDDGDAAGKEYAIPGEDARREGSGGSGNGGSGPSGGSGDGGSSPADRETAQPGTSGDGGGSGAFGEGISKAAPNDSGDRADSGTAGVTSDGPAAADTASASANRSSGDVGEASPALWSAGLALALLATAGVAWLVVRRRRTSASA